MTQGMTSDQLISIFAKRATRLETVYSPEQMATMPFDAQVRLTIKQTKWLLDVFRCERIDFPTRGRNAGTHGVLPDGRGYDLNIQRNGTAILNLRDATRLKEIQ